MEWKELKKQKPPTIENKEIEYLVYIDDRLNSGVYVSIWDSDIQHFVDSYNYRTLPDTVTHWMEYPNPPSSSEPSSLTAESNIKQSGT